MNLWFCNFSNLILTFWRSIINKFLLNKYSLISSLISKLLISCVSPKLAFISNENWYSTSDRILVCTKKSLTLKTYFINVTWWFWKLIYACIDKSPKYFLTSYLFLIKLHFFKFDIFALPQHSLILSAFNLTKYLKIAFTTRLLSQAVR